MILPDALYAYLSTEMSVGDRVYPRILPKSVVYPCMSYQIIPAVGPVKVHSDAHDDGLGSGLFMRTRIQLDCWAKTYREADILAREVRQRLHGFSGLMGDLLIGSIHLDIDMDSYDDEYENYRRILDGMVSYNEA
jgi:hypothetical protein